MTVIEFVEMYPQYGLGVLANENRVNDNGVLSSLPTELIAVGPYMQGRRGKPNPNNTKTHRQCRECKRVYRNDLFSWQSDKSLPAPYCSNCKSKIDRDYYNNRADLLADRRARLWKLFAKGCAICGLDVPQIMEFHHVRDKKDLVSQFIARVAASPSPSNVQALLSESAKCVCLCPNHHRMLHCGLIELPDNASIIQPTIGQIMDALSA